MRSTSPNTVRRSAMLSVCALTAAAGLASGGVIRHDVDDALYQSLGQDARYDSVGVLLLSNGNTCSGALIGEEWVLTAAHCVDEGVTNAQWVTNTAFGASAEIIIHPDWVVNNFTAGNDLALIRLTAPVTNVQAARLINGQQDLGALGTSVGFGRTGTGFTGDLPGTSGTKRAGTNQIDGQGSAFGWSSSILLTDFDNPLNPSDSTFGDSTPTALEMQVGAGDSGGAIFVDDGQGGAVIAGITSFIASTDGISNADYGDFSGYTRVSDYLPWIYSVTGIPAPGVTGMLAIGLIGSARRRR